MMTPRPRFFTWAISVLLIACTSASASIAAPSTAVPATPSAIGLWVNPYQSVQVRTGNCNGLLCGWIVWASPQAQSDARDSGITNLIGTALLRNYRAMGASHYRGQVYVPDMGRTFYSTIDQQDANTLTIRGCILNGLICKSQTWRRVGQMTRLR